MLMFKSFNHNWQLFTHHVNSVVAYSIILSELLVSNLIFEERLGWFSVYLELLCYVKRNLFLISESIIANYAGGGKWMDYDLWDVTVDDSASNGVLLSEKISTLFCFCGFGRGLIER